MRRTILIVITILVSLCGALEFRAQTPYPPQSQATPAKPALDPAMLADDWMERFDGLSKWYLSVDGKEVGRDEVVNRMMELYAPDAIAEVPPHDEDQIGPIVLRGSANIRKWVDRLSRTQVKLLYIQRKQTKKQFEGQKLVFSMPLPWGGLGISFEIIAAYSRREDRRKFTGPGSVFLQYGADGKIERLRLYVAEISEVHAL